MINKTERQAYLKGFAVGYATGTDDTKAEIAKQMQKIGYSVEAITNATGLPKQKILAIISTIAK